MNDIQTAFAYSDLTPDTRTIVEAATDRLHTLERKTGEQIIEMGRELIRVKAALDHGQFGSWIDAEFGWSRDTAQRFMNVAQVFGGREMPHGAVFQAKALYALASSNTPQIIRDEFIAKAEAGERVTHKDVKERVNRSKFSRKAIEEEALSMRKYTMTKDLGPAEPRTGRRLSDLPYEQVDVVTGEIIDIKTGQQLAQTITPESVAKKIAALMDVIDADVPDTFVALTKSPHGTDAIARLSEIIDVLKRIHLYAHEHAGIHRSA